MFKFKIQTDGQSVTRVDFCDGDQSSSDPLSQEAARQLNEYLSGTRQAFDLPLAPSGTPFQRKVWNALLEIPYGDTWTYGQLATHIGHPGAARAVGGACHNNPISIVIPCHRVVGSNAPAQASTPRGLVGYAGGLDKKKWLLDLEKTITFF